MELIWLIIVWFIIECIIGVVGIIGNFVVCFVIIKYCMLNMVFINILIRNVVIGDLVLFLIFFLFFVVRE